mmetsp:Transcript_43062/g.68219  ORF Transcript_43062/g.68219 Transcript_43062/m.68219 type:complete len:202 (+) Transcript_43062:886-1491(+)
MHPFLSTWTRSSESSSHNHCDTYPTLWLLWNHKAFHNGLRPLRYYGDGSAGHHTWCMRPIQTMLPRDSPRKHSRRTNPLHMAPPFPELHCKPPRRLLQGSEPGGHGSCVHLRKTQCTQSISPRCRSRKTCACSVGNRSLPSLQQEDCKPSPLSVRYAHTASHCPVRTSQYYAAVPVHQSTCCCRRTTPANQKVRSLGQAHS